MQSVEFIKKDGITYAKVENSGLPDIPRPYKIVFRTEVKDEFETIALTEEQALTILDALDRGSAGVRIGDEYRDRYLIYKIIKPKK